MRKSPAVICALALVAAQSPAFAAPAASPPPADPRTELRALQYQTAYALAVGEQCSWLDAPRKAAQTALVQDVSRRWSVVPASQRPARSAESVIEQAFSKAKGRKPQCPAEEKWISMKYGDHAQAFWLAQAFGFIVAAERTPALAGVATFAASKARIEKRLVELRTNLKPEEFSALLQTADAETPTLLAHACTKRPGGGRPGSCPSVPGATDATRTFALKRLEGAEAAAQTIPAAPVPVAAAASAEPTHSKNLWKPVNLGGMGSLDFVAVECPAGEAVIDFADVTPAPGKNYEATAVRVNRAGAFGTVTVGVDDGGMVVMLNSNSSIISGGLVKFVKCHTTG